MSDLKLKDVLYLFPAMIECEIGGNSNSVFVYIDYRHQDIVVPDVTGISDMEQFKAIVSSRVFHKTIIDKPPMPKQVHESIDPRSFNPSFEEFED
jgi:hypothetical protein